MPLGKYASALLIYSNALSNNVKMTQIVTDTHSCPNNKQDFLLNVFQINTSIDTPIFFYHSLTSSKHCDEKIESLLYFEGFDSAVMVMLRGDLDLLIIILLLQ